MSKIPSEEVTIDHNGQKFTLVLDIHSVMLAEDHMGLAMHEILAQAAQQRIRPVIALLWAALQRHHPMTMEQATVWVQEVGLGRLNKKLAGALGATKASARKKAKAA